MKMPGIVIVGVYWCYVDGVDVAVGDDVRVFYVGVGIGFDLDVDVLSRWRCRWGSSSLSLPERVRASLK